MKRLIDWVAERIGAGQDPGDLQPFLRDRVAECEVALILFDGPGGTIVQGTTADGTRRLLKVWPAVSRDPADQRSLEAYVGRLAVVPATALRVLESGLTPEGDFYVVQEWTGVPMAQNQALHRFLPEHTDDRLDLFAAIVAGMRDLEAVGVAPTHLTTHQIFQEPSGTIRIDPIGAPYPPPHRHKRLRKRKVDEMHLLRWPPPPEAMGDRTLDVRGAVWCLGYLGFELVAGSPPFSGIDPTVISMALLLEMPPPLRQINPQVPAAFENLINRMLSRDMSMRPQTVAACWAEVDRIMKSL